MVLAAERGQGCDIETRSLLRMERESLRPCSLLAVTIRQGHGIRFRTVWLGGATVAATLLLGAAVARGLDSGLGTSAPLRGEERQAQAWEMTGVAAKVDSTIKEVAIINGARCSYELQTMCSALDLLESPKVQAVAVQNVMRTGQGLLGPYDERSVEASVAAIFRKVSLELKTHAPKVAAQMRQVNLTKLRRNAVLGTLRLISDRRVQSMGVEVAETIRTASATDPAELRDLINQRLNARLKDIQFLRNEVISSQLRELLDEERQWAMTLDAESIRALQGTDGRPVKKLVSDRPDKTSLNAQDKSYGILGGVLAQVRTVFGIIGMCASSANVKIALPSFTKSAVGRITPALLSCDAADEAKRVTVDAMQTLFCPLQFGTMGLDALRAAGIPHGGSIPWMR